MHQLHASSAKIYGALDVALRAIDDDVERVVNICHEGRTSPVEFEWIGEPLSLECSSSRGANSTSVDAFVIAETKSGSKRAYLIEWKYTEGDPPNRRNYGPSVKGYKTRRGRYSSLYHESNSFSATLKEPDREFATVTPSQLLDAVQRECSENEKVSDWAEYMQKRYGL